MFLPPWAWLGALVGVASAAELDPDEAVRSALRHDPAYLAAVAAVVEADGRLRAARFFRSNPSLGAELSLLEPRWSASLEQPLSLSGEGLARAAEARAARDAAELDRRRAALVAAAEARASWAEAAAADARLALASRAHAEARARRAATEARVAAGDRPELEARLARLGETEAALGLVEAEAARRTARVALARFVPDAAGLVLVGELQDAVPEGLGAGERADVAAARRRAEAAEAGLRAERAAVLPPVVLGATVEREGALTFAGPSVELSLPLWKANPAGRASARAAATLAQAEAERADRQADTEARTAEAAAARSRALRAGLPDPTEDALAALGPIDRAEAGGELDPATATLLRQQLLDGAMAGIALEHAAVLAELDALLASSDPALLPPELRELSR